MSAIWGTGLVGNAVNCLGVADIAVDDGHLAYEVEAAESLHVAFGFLFDTFGYEAIDEGIHVLRYFSVLWYQS